MEEMRCKIWHAQVVCQKGNLWVEEDKRIPVFPFVRYFFFDYPSDIRFSPHFISCTQIVSHSFLIYYLSDLPLLLAIPVHIDKIFGSSILSDRIRCAPIILLKISSPRNPG